MNRIHLNAGHHIKNFVLIIQILEITETSLLTNFNIVRNILLPHFKII